MPFLAPLFLLGVAGIAIPLLVHLVHREKRQPTAFPSLMFLERTPAPFSSRRNLRDPLLLLLRALAVLALILAFARPVFDPRPGSAAVDTRRREIVVLLDRSFSMRVADRWPRARAAVDSTIRSLAAGDRLTLVAFDRRARAVTAATGDAETLRAALDSLRPTDESTRLAPAIAVAEQRLSASDAPRKVLMVVSDFQRSGWDLTDAVTLPSGTEIATRDVSGSAMHLDRSVRAVEVRRDRRPGPAQVIVTARLGNVGDPARSVLARLEVGGRVVEERRVDLARDAGATVTFGAVPAPPDAVPARVVLEADSISGDDAFHFLLSQAPTLPVLVLDGRATPFVAQALSIGDAPTFAVVSRSPSRVAPADLTSQRLVILTSGAFPTGLGAERLQRFVADGGGMIVALGADADARDWPTAARSLLPGAIRPITDRTGGTAATLGEIDGRHPALALLATSRASDLVATRFVRYRSVDTTGGVLARFDDGTAAMTEHTVGRGRVITFGSSLDGEWNDLPRQPAFLPLLQQLSRYAANWREAPRAFVIGTTIRPSDLSPPTQKEVSRWVATAPSGARITVGGESAPATLELGEMGVHELRPGGSPGARPLLVAANIAPAELEFASFDPVRLTNALTPVGKAAAPGVRAAPVESLADREARQSSWWYLLLAASCLLIAESVVARRLVSRTPVVE